MSHAPSDREELEEKIHAHQIHFCLLFPCEADSWVVGFSPKQATTYVLLKNVPNVGRSSGVTEQSMMNDCHIKPMKKKLNFPI